MDRRELIKLGGLSMVGVLAGCGTTPGRGASYQIRVSDASKIGHMLLSKSSENEPIPVGRVETVVVGGGVSGMAALYALRNDDAILLELDEGLGGTSGVGYKGNVAFSTGAHYDLAYPSHYGAESLKALEEIGVIQHFSDLDMWEFVDRKYEITPEKESQCLRDGQWYSDPLSGLPGEQEFRALMSQYEGRLPMPTRLIASDLVDTLDQQTFHGWLQSHPWYNDQLRRSIDYQLKDDYGAGADSVSALAGIHYYACRPYSSVDVQLFSPPEGNYYFIRRMLEKAGPEKVRKGCLISGIERRDGGYDVRYLDLKDGRTYQMESEKVIYTGKKHALPRVLSPDLAVHYQSQRVETDYAPWMVVSIVVPRNRLAQGIWQNDDLDGSADYLGCVNGNAQWQEAPWWTTITAYYCLEGSKREELLKVHELKDQVAKRAIEDISRSLGRSVEDHVVEVHVKVMGHAMPIPKPGYLSKGRLVDPEIAPGLFLAGVDHGRLPLFFEALDSGITVGSLASSSGSE